MLAISLGTSCGSGIATNDSLLNSPLEPVPTSAESPNFGPSDTTQINTPSATTATTTAPATTTTPGPTTAPTTTAKAPTATPFTTTKPQASASDCYLTGSRSALTLAHERPTDRLYSTGNIDVVVLFTDFQDVSATQSTQSIFSIISPGGENFLEDQSNERLQLSFRPHHQWLRLGSSASTYAEAIKTYDGHRKFMQEAIDLADAEVNFLGAEAVLVVATPNATEIRYGPTWMGVPSSPLQADGQIMTNGITSGADLTYWKHLWYPHEFGHSLGLPDLYGANIPGRGGWTRPFSLMDDISSSAPGYMGYSRWVLKWIDDSQVRCVTANATVALTPLATPTGAKLVVVPLTSTSALVAEVRRATGYDAELQREGVIVYVVDTNNRGRNGGSYGDGPIEVLNNARSLGEGESLTHFGVSFEVLESQSTQDLIRITFNDTDD